MRSQFTFYKSFDDVLEDLNDKQIAEYIKAMLDVQFLRVRVDEVNFSDKLLSIIWKSQKHSIQTSINGYLDSQKREKVKDPYYGCYDPKFTPYKGGTQQEQEQEQDKRPNVVDFEKFKDNPALLSAMKEIAGRVAEGGTE